MNNDAFILLSAGVMFITFLCLHAIVFRFISIHEGLAWITRTACLTGIGGSLFLFLYRGDIVISLLCFFVYGTLVVLYVFGIFIIIESSITFRILYEIAIFGTHGGTINDLTKKYNKETIVTRRLERLAVVGEIIRNKNVYRINQKKSVFTFRNELVKFNNFFFPFKK